jgi:Outer membrane protein beta-barrel domain
LRKIILVIGILLILTTAVNAQSLKLSAGVFGGVSVPVLQDDQSQGTVFGIMARYNLLSIFQIEPYISFGKWGSPDPIESDEPGGVPYDLGIDGSKVTSFGFDVLIGGAPGAPGLKPTFIGGIGYYKIKNDDTGYEESKMGFAAGLGLNLGFIPKFDIDIRAKAIIIPQEEGSKKAVNITAGLLYNFGPGI